MSVDRLYRNLMNKLINANIDLDAYLQLRKAKGYMSVSENDHLRDNLFELCHEMRQHAPRLQHVVAPEEKDALRLAGEAVASAAVCLLSGHHDCPSYIHAPDHYPDDSPYRTVAACGCPCRPGAR